MSLFDLEKLSNTETHHIYPHPKITRKPSGGTADATGRPGHPVLKPHCAHTPLPGWQFAAGEAWSYESNWTGYHNGDLQSKITQLQYAKQNPLIWSNIFFNMECFWAWTLGFWMEYMSIVIFTGPSRKSTTCNGRRPLCIGKPSN